MTTTPTASPELPDLARRVHELKTDPEVFAAVLADRKTHEIRFNDRDFQVGDELLLRETAHSGAEMAARPDIPLIYTDRAVRRTVSHIQTGYGLTDGWCILSFARRAQPEGEAPQAAAPDAMTAFRKWHQEVGDQDCEYTWLQAWTAAQLSKPASAPGTPEAPSRDDVLEEAASACEGEFCSCCWSDDEVAAGAHMAATIRGMKSRAAQLDGDQGEAG